MITVTEKEENRLKSELEERVEALKNRMVELSSEIHENPERSLQEYEARDLLVSELANEGFEPKKGLAGLETAFRCTFTGSEPEPEICFMFEYDALEDLGHACGHNLSGVASLGAAIGLKRVVEEHDLPGKIVALGTPGEELYSGKVPMVNAGVFDGVDAALMAHMFDRTVLNPKFIALEGLEFKFTGRASHAAGAPEEGINALNGVIQTFENINALRQHVKDGVRIHGIITDGGSAINIVPEKAVAKFFVRAEESRYLEEVVGRVKKCAEGAAVGTGTNLEIDSFESSEDLVNNPVLAEVFEENLRRYTERVQETTEEIVGSTDVGNVSKAVPTIHPMIKITEEGTALHTEAFARAAQSEKGFAAMLLAAKALGLSALELIVNEKTLSRVRKTFQEDN